MARIRDSTYNHHNNMLAALQIRIPSRKQPRPIEAAAAPHLIGIAKSGGDPVSMMGEKITVAIGDVRFAFPGQLDLALQ